MSYDDQYDAPLSGPERVRVQALDLARSDGLVGEAWVEMARPLERYIIGDRATAVKQQIEAAYVLADKLLEDGLKAAGADNWNAPESLTLNTQRLQELVRALSKLADGAPF
jgi:hypothetical protein